MVMAVVLMNEALTFHINYFDNTPTCNILNVVGFYTTDEVAQAKTCYLMLLVLSIDCDLQAVCHVTTVHRR